MMYITVDIANRSLAASSVHGDHTNLPNDDHLTPTPQVPLYSLRKYSKLTCFFVTTCHRSDWLTV